MKQLRLILLTFFIGAVTILAGCANKPFLITEDNHANYNNVLVKAGDEINLTTSQLYDMLYKSNILTNGGVLDTTLTRHFIDSLITDSLTGIKARSIDISKYYNQYRIFKLRYYDFLIRQYLKHMVYDKVSVDSTAAVDFYYKNPDLFSIDEQVNLYHIALTKNILLNGKDSLMFRKMSPEALDSAMNVYADSIKGLITSPEKFTEVAKEHSEDEVSAQEGGYLGWTKRNVYPPPFDSVAFSLKVGEIGGPYQDENGWHIIMIDNRFDRGLPPLNENLYIAAKKSLQTKESNAIGQKLIDSLFADYDVKLNPDILDTNLFVVDGQTWAAIINGLDTIDCNEGRSFELNYRTKYHVDNTTPEMKRDMFKTIGEKYVLVQAARNIGLEKDSTIQAEKQRLWNKYAKSVIDDQIYDVAWEPTDSLIDAYYTAHQADFESKKPLKVQQIIVADSTYGEFLRDQAMSGYDFMELAKEYYPGDKSLREELADLGYIGPDDVSKAFYDAAMKTPIGEVSHPVKTKYGYHIIKVLDRKESESVSKARFKIIPILKDEHRKESFNNYKKDIFNQFNVQYVGKLFPIHLKPKKLRN